MIPRAENGSITLAARSPGLADAAVEVVVTLPTFRRPLQLLETLRSLRDQTTQRRIAVVVMDNDAERREGSAAAAPLFAEGGMEGLVIIAHERGNCCAYNAGWETALVHFPAFAHIAVIDDDEVADPDWIERLCAAAARFDADIVGGPQVPVFEDGAKAHLFSHPIFAPPYGESGPVPALYSSGNLLIARDVLAAMPMPFLDLRFNFLGGGDSDFLSRAAQRGFRLAWAADAPVREAVPARRTQADWLRARAVRNGVISTLVEQRRRAGSPFSRTRVALKSLALLGAAPLRGAARLAKGRPLREAIYPAQVAAGRILAEFGYAHEQYRNPEKN